jgi:hypothetical protein
MSVLIGEINFMADAVTLEQVEGLAAQLAPQEQLKLLARVSEWLSQLPLTAPEPNAERQRREYAARIEAFLKMCDENAAESIGEVDSAEDLRQIREERVSQLNRLVHDADDNDGNEAMQSKRAARADAILALCDAAAAAFPGQSDAAEEIRRMRDERIEQIRQSDA